MTDLERQQRQHAAASLKEFARILKDNNVTFWLTLGTCLGAYRDKDFCVNDFDDIDLGVHYREYDRIDEITEKLEQAGWENHHNFISKDGISPEHCFQKPNNLRFRNKIDLWFYTPNPKDPSELTFRFYRDTAAKEYNTKTNPARHFESLAEIEFYGDKYPIPSDVEEYLKINYGDWRTPKPRPEWDYYTDNQSPSP